MRASARRSHILASVCVRVCVLVIWAASVFARARTCVNLHRTHHLSMQCVAAANLFGFREGERDFNNVLSMSGYYANYRVCVCV